MPSQNAPRGEEPPMFLQRPSTGKSQDVRHILAKTFRELFTRDAVGPDTMKNLAVSKGGDDPYHERYVDALQKVSKNICCDTSLEPYCSVHSNEGLIIYFCGVLSKLL